MYINTKQQFILLS